MKKIIVPTDFSPGANNALAYAAGLAREFNYHIVLLRAYEIPMPPVEVPAPVLSPEIIEPELHTKMDAFAADYPDIIFEKVIKQGDAVNELIKLVAQTKPAMVVMGMRGAGKLSRIFVGSTTTSYMRMMKLPLLVIPLGASYKQIKKIVLAADTTDFETIGGMPLLEQLATAHHARVSVLSFNNYKVKPLVSKDHTRIKLGEHLHDVETVVHFEEHDNVVEGINAHVDKYHSDMVVMVPHQHTFLERIFGASSTEDMAFNTQVPLLALPDKKVMTLS